MYVMRTAVLGDTKVKKSREKGAKTKGRRLHGFHRRR